MGNPPAEREVVVLLRPRDPLVFRDARPFSADPGAQAFTLDWPFPQTVTGAIRSHVVAAAAGFGGWDDAARALALSIRVDGPFRLAGEKPEPACWEFFFPPPRDIVSWTERDGKATVFRLRPQPRAKWQGSGSKTGGWSAPLGPTGRPAVGLRPVATEHGGHPIGEFDAWSWPDLATLIAKPGAAPPAGVAPAPNAAAAPQLLLPRLPRDGRTHVRINAKTLTHLEGFLFGTSGLAFGDAPGLAAPMGEPALALRRLEEKREGGRKVFAYESAERLAAAALVCRVSLPAAVAWTPTPAFVQLGGEGRLARLEPLARGEWPWSKPKDEDVRPFVGATRLRLQLLTPAVFAHGWLPDWLKEVDVGGEPALVGSPGSDAPRLRLVAAVVGRREPVSGWDLRAGGEKATRFAVPAGSVYFFDVLDGAVLTPDIVRALWFRAVGDHPAEDANIGNGLVLPGLWEEHGG